jgi:hypothetical protein
MKQFLNGSEKSLVIIQSTRIVYWRIFPGIY